VYLLTHVVFFRLKPECKDKAKHLVAKILDMKGKIPELREIQAGVDVVQSARSYDVGLIAQLDDLASMQSYQVHPVHQELLKFVGQVVESSVAVDFES
jgi:antibiotic biosynthesis monooxygenase (ABM) superfamily enzyme